MLTPAEIDIIDPKRAPRSENGRALWYPYYAGYSPDFASRLISSVLSADERLPPNVLDPWNGSGTSTWAANALGIESVGVDLNPVMRVVAQARLLSRREAPSLIPLARELLAFHPHEVKDANPSDPLCVWFVPSSAAVLRTLEGRIAKVLIGLPPESPVTPNSSLAAFYYVGLFRLVRRLTSQFVGSNPTWVRRPQTPSHRVRPKHDRIGREFLAEIEAMSVALENCENLSDASTHIIEASSASLPLFDDSVGLVLTSPPYCTRIDYAISTSRELAVLGFDLGSSFRRLRSKMLGTSTVSTSKQTEPRAAWGPTCNRFLEKVWHHDSKASRSYYYPNFLQYFGLLFVSIEEIARVVSGPGLVALVVQDSYYKNVHNDLPAIAKEMLSSVGFLSVTRRDFRHPVSMAQINSGRRRQDSAAIESVVVVQREG